MAIFRSSLLADVRGSIGGSVYSRNRSGSYIRNRTKPINVNSTNQTAVRDRFGSIASDFQTLDRAGALAWTQYAALLPRFNALGEEYIPSGKQIFIETNLNLQVVGQGIKLAPAFGNTTVPALNLNAVVITAELSLGVINALSFASLANQTEATHMVIQATPPMQAVRSSYRNRMREVYAGAFAAAPNFLAAYQTYFGGGDPVAASEGQIINFRIRAINSANGLGSAWYYLTAEITAP